MTLTSSPCDCRISVSFTKIENASDFGTTCARSSIVCFESHKFDYWKPFKFVRSIGVGRCTDLADKAVDDASLNDSNAWRAWGPITYRGYTFDGLYDPDPPVQDPDMDTHLCLDFVISEELIRRGAERIVAQKDTYYEGPDGETRVDFYWSSSGHLQYLDGARAVRAFQEILPGHELLNTNNIRASISRGERMLLVLASTAESGETVGIYQREGYGLEFEGPYYLHRPLSRAYIRTLIRLASEHTNQYHPDSPIEQKTYEDHFGNVQLRIGFDGVPARGGPRVTYGMVALFLGAASNFYDVHAGAELYGDLYLNGGGDTIGYFKVTHYTGGQEPLSGTNSTSVGQVGVASQVQSNSSATFQY